MERLTYWNEEYDCWSYHGPSGEAAKRLAAYEETGLEPEDMKRAFNEDAILKLAGQVLGVSSDRLRELAQAKKKGRLVVLPCEIGSPVYSHARKLDGADYVRETEFWWSGFNEPGFGLRSDRLGVDTGFGC